ncbi:apolipoprotein N-acyltransferase [Humibacter sp. RRB41]|uniref:apolipoprotein N-acyltransferase n=1 Tax=Humibacter sp. RRB41 TaxID=2919946 RepID=UPI001FA9CA96|nr:apolipoprotein N-acyltransferase [Humibacter sp. RRB41]
MSQPPRPLLPLWLAVIVGAGGGVVYDGAFPAIGWWPLAFVGLALMLLPLIGRSAGGGLLVGFCSGLAFYLTQVSWTALYLGPVPWVALSIFESLFFAVAALVITLAYRWIPRAFPSAAGRLGLLPVAVAGVWTAREWASGNWPYGGFAWGRAALSQSQSPLAHLVAWFGIAGVSFLMVWLVALAIECVRYRGHPLVWLREKRTDAPAARPWPRVALALGAIALVLAVPLWPAATSGTTRIAAVQGNGPAGYFDHAHPGDVMNAQIKATIPLIGKKVDMVVWPEGSADIDPTSDYSSAAVMNNLSTQLGAPMIVGTITHRHGKYYNTSLLWKAGKGAVAYYDKKHPVPFGEYVPDRSFWLPFAPSLLGLIQRQYTPGTRPNVFDVNGVKAGISICFDIVDDQLTTDMMNGGAQVILAQTNNADFGRTKENMQQLAIARLRAIETGRSLVNISTVGTSQIIDPDGRTIDQIPAYRPGAMLTDVPLGTTTTPATLLSRAIEVLVCGLGLGAVVVAAVTMPRRRSRRR